MKVFIIAAISADGFIARNTTEFVDWTTPEDKKLFVELTKQAGIMVMGRTTFDTIGRALPSRRTIVYTSHSENVLAEGVETTDLAPADLLQQLADKGAEQVAICGGGSIYSLFLKSGLVTELFLTIEPVIFGAGIPLFDQPLDSKMELIEVRNLNESTLLAHYKLFRPTA